MTEVYKFITSILGTDCAGEKDLTYLTLRVKKHFKKLKNGNVGWRKIKNNLELMSE